MAQETLSRFAASAEQAGVPRVADGVRADAREVYAAQSGRVAAAAGGVMCWWRAA